MLWKSVAYLACFIFQLCLFQAFANAQEAFELVNTFTSGHRFGGSSITIGAEGTYKTEASDCTTEYFSSGKYTFAENLLSFSELRRKWQRHGFDEQDWNRRSAEEKELTKDFFGQTEFAEGSKIFKMVPVRWAERLYLIYEGELENFCHAINFGIEPRLELSSEPHYGSFYLRVGDEFKDVTGMPDLPEKWLEMLLRKPVSAKVIKIEKGEADEMIVTINKGSVAGLKVGIRLLFGNQEPSFWNSATVISVEKRSARLSTTLKTEVGDVLNSRFTRGEEEERFIRLRREVEKKAREAQ